MPSGKQYIRVLQELKNGGDGTSFEIAAVLDLPAPIVSAQLSRLHRFGLVARARQYIPGTNGKPPFRYRATG